MKIITAAIICLLIANTGFTRQQEFKEVQSPVIKPIGFIYTAGIEKIKTIDGVQYSFFSLDWYITSKGRFLKIFLLEKEKIIANPEFDITNKAFLSKVFVKMRYSFKQQTNLMS